MARQKQPNSDRLYVTVPKDVVVLAEKLMCPAGMKTPPKTALSMLVTQVMQDFFERTYDSSMIQLHEVLEKQPEITHAELTELCKNLPKDDVLAGAGL